MFKKMPVSISWSDGCYSWRTEENPTEDKEVVYISFKTYLWWKVMSKLDSLMQNQLRNLDDEIYERKYEQSI